jgi:hypothetical protein
MQIRGWSNVPDRSSLVAKVSGDEDTFIATGQIFVDGNLASHYSTAELVKGVSLNLRSPHRVVLEVDVVLTAKTTVDVTGSLQGPQGKTFGTPFAGQVAGVNGDHDHIELTALTRL